MKQCVYQCLGDRSLMSQEWEVMGLFSSTKVKNQQLESYKL